MPLVMDLVTMTKASKLEESFALQLRGVIGNHFDREYAFHPVRKWRFDFAFPSVKLAIELEGGVASHGQVRTTTCKRTGLPKKVKQQSRHLTPGGFEEDCRKYGEAAILGWRVIRLPASLVKNGEGIALVERALAENRGEW